MKTRKSIVELEKEANAAGVPPFLWMTLRDIFGQLSVREKLRPEHWQKKLYEWFETEPLMQGLPVDEARIRSAITAMMNSSRSWCSPEVGVDDAQALKAIRTALDTILEPQDSTDTDKPSEDSGQLSPVDMQARTA